MVRPGSAHTFSAPTSPPCAPRSMERARPFPSNSILAIAALGTGVAASCCACAGPPEDVFGLQLGISSATSSDCWVPTSPSSLELATVVADPWPISLGLGGLELTPSLLGAPVCLGRHSAPARILPAPLRRAGPDLAEVKRDGPISSPDYHSPILVGASSADARPRGAVLLKLRARRNGCLRFCFLAAGALLAIPVVRRVV